MKKLLLSLSLVIISSSTWAQAIIVEEFNFMNYGFINNMFIRDNDQMVLSCSSGIFILNDTIEIQKIDSSGVNAFKGKNGNIIFPYGAHGFAKWNNNNLTIFPGDSNITIANVYKATELSNGKILCLKSTVDGKLFLIDANGTTDLAPNRGFVLPSMFGNFIELNSDLIFSRLNLLGDNIFYQPSTNNLTIFNDTAIFGPYTIIKYSKGSANSYNLSHVNGIINLTDSTVNSILYYNSLGNNFQPQRGNSTIMIDDNLMILNADYLVQYDGTNIILYDSSDGYSGPTNLLDIFLNSRKQIYASLGNSVYKITTPLATELISEGRDTFFKIYPNPFYDSFLIKSNQEFDVLKLHDLQGKVILEKPINTHPKSHHIYINAALKPGVYIAIFTKTENRLID